MQVPLDLEIARELPPSGSSVRQAELYTRWLATHHYENFIVASMFLPRHLRQHFYNIYAYCRWADDLADEIPDRSAAMELLDWWGTELNKCYSGSVTHCFIDIGLPRPLTVLITNRSNHEDTGPKIGETTWVNWDVGNIVAL